MSARVKPQWRQVRLILHTLTAINLLLWHRPKFWAKQHYDTLYKFLAPLGVTIALLTGSQTPAQKKQIRQLIADGQIDIAVGTQALIQKSTRFSSLGLVITDEQHRFGVGQRAALGSKATSLTFL